MKIFNSTSTLYDPIVLGSISCANRVVMAPLTRSRATEDNVPTKIMADYYAQRASAGLIISEATNISEQGISWHQSPGIWSQEQILAWRPITSAVHKKQGRIICQLYHGGRRAHSALSGMQPIAPSSIKTPGYGHGRYGARLDPEVPNEMSLEDIEHTIKAFGRAAKNAIDAGFDGVEIHASNGYLIDQFLQSSSNQRTDKYGGDIQNRLRFLREVVEEIIKNIDVSRVGIGFSPHNGSGGMGCTDNRELFDEAIRFAAIRNLAYVHLMDGVSYDMSPNTPQYTLHRAQNIIKQTCETAGGEPNTIKLIGNGGYDKQSAEGTIRDGIGDMIAFGSLYISNPDLYERFKYNGDLKILTKEEMKNLYFLSKGQNYSQGYTTFPSLKIYFLSSEYMKFRSGSSLNCIDPGDNINNVDYVADVTARVDTTTNVDNSHSTIGPFQNKRYRYVASIK